MKKATENSPPSPPVSTLLQQASHRLEKQTDNPQLNAQLLLAHVLDKDRSYLFAWPDHIPTQQQYKQFSDHLQQRLQGIPIAYILGYQEFWSMPFTVTPDVLIPRPETELLVEHVIIACTHLTEPSILELGTGSGAIAIALGKELPNAHITATDLSKKALSIARQNAKNLQTQQIKFCQSDWFTNITTHRFDIIVSNPPYIETNDPHLLGEIRFEPKQALISGEDGLDDNRKIIRESIKRLNPHGKLLIEHGHNQATQIRNLMKAAGFKDCQTIKDYATIDRITWGKAR